MEQGGIPGREGRTARLLIADDHVYMRAGLKFLLEARSEFDVVGEAGDGKEVISQCNALQPDLILMDVGMPKMDGIEATRLIKERYPKMIVLVLTSHVSEDVLLEAIRAGAAGYVLKGSGHEHLVEAIRAVLAGETPIDQGLAIQLLRRLALEDSPPEEVPTPTVSDEPFKDMLSVREIEALCLIAAGKTNRQIAQDLTISLSSVKTYVQRIIKKLGVSDRTQACVKAIEMGLLPEQERR